MVSRGVFLLICVSIDRRCPAAVNPRAAVLASTRTLAQIFWPARVVVPMKAELGYARLPTLRIRIYPPRRRAEGCPTVHLLTFLSPSSILFGLKASGPLLVSGVAHQAAHAARCVLWACCSPSSVELISVVPVGPRSDAASYK